MKLMVIEFEEIWLSSLKVYDYRVWEAIEFGKVIEFEMVIELEDAIEFEKVTELGALSSYMVYRVRPKKKKKKKKKKKIFLAGNFE